MFKCEKHKHLLKQEEENNEPMIASYIRLIGFALAIIHSIIMMSSLSPESLLRHYSITPKNQFINTIIEKNMLSDNGMNVLNGIIKSHSIKQIKEVSLDENYSLYNTKYRTVVINNDFLKDIRTFVNSAYTVLFAAGIIGAILLSETTVDIVLFKRVSKESKKIKKGAIAKARAQRIVILFVYFMVLNFYIELLYNVTKNGIITNTSSLI